MILASHNQCAKLVTDHPLPMFKNTDAGQSTHHLKNYINPNKGNSSFDALDTQKLQLTLTVSDCASVIKSDEEESVYWLQRTKDSHEYLLKDKDELRNMMFEKQYKGENKFVKTDVARNWD